MTQEEQLFDDPWRAGAVAGGRGDSWANDVVAALDSEGGHYLATLAKWFTQFPTASTTDRAAMKARLESFTTSDHLGAVNELAWYQFMRQSGFQIDPISTAKTARPDFMLTGPTPVFAEVSTLNVSDGEKASLRDTGGVGLNHRETVRRLLLKVSDEKRAQFEYAAANGLPCLLVLFDYTFWSGLATDLYRFLASELLRDAPAFSGLPSALSAIVYVERRVMAGRIVLSRLRSAIYHNPAASYGLDPRMFNMLRHFGHDIREIAPGVEGDWIEL
ncbi:MAG TPA: hypothetical protein VK466_00115 [Terriglobales bacterium]|nr:hypothetical protein [Terriglobales bacterium]